MTPVDVETLRQRAANGDGDAQLALSRVLDDEGRHDVALQWLQRAADGGHRPSLAALGARLLTGRAAPHMPSQGLQMISHAADGGDAQACALMAVLAAAGEMRPQSWSAALEYLFRAAQRGSARARQQIAILVNDAALGARILEPGVGQPWAEARAAIDLGAWLRPSPGKAISESPQMLVFERFISPGLCHWIVGLAQPVLSARGAGASEKRDDPLQTNSGVVFTLVESDVLLQIVNARIAAVSGLPAGNQEPTNILHYATGQTYKPHVDFMDPGVPQLAAAMRREGQRVASLFIYLNDGFEGGETDFPLIGVRFRGRPGDAILFSNVDAQGAVDPRTLHAGLAPTQGEKWLLSKWIRDRPVPQL